MDYRNPLASEDQGRARRSTSTDADSPKSKPSGMHKRLIGELGLRYRPSAQADLEDHAAALALLTMDLADVPPRLLSLAIDQWVSESHFMPKASDLIDRAKAMLNPAKPGEKRADIDQMNAKLTRDGHHHIRWIREGEHLKLVPDDHRPTDESRQCTPVQARQILRDEGIETPFLLEILGAIERARPIAQTTGRV